ncbi:hypothetical protein [Mycobacteroides salmoniphilum]|uniref:hypothetical protein n=1 Tax=Mycobacteroides salmoniphilum TaxID=404941 RepID=UPI00106657B1|nr:hypothetical protein [Mycobacteroides salmoniphilum]
MTLTSIGWDRSGACFCYGEQMNRFWVAVVSSSVFSLLMAPLAFANPDFPDLSGYAEVDAANYRADMGYGNVGARFRTPDGLYCTLDQNIRATSGQGVFCRGALPGADGATSVGGFDAIPVWGQYDSSKPETVDHLDEGGVWKKVTIDPVSYHLLPSGSKITFRAWPSMKRYLTCAVDRAGMTACVSYYGQDTDDHGFVLKPEGSLVF